MTEIEQGEYAYKLDKLARGFIAEGEHMRENGEYDFTHGLHVRTDNTRNDKARTALSQSYDKVVADLGTDSLLPEHWGNVLGMMSFPNLVRIAANSPLIAERKIPQGRLREALARKAGSEVAEFNSALVDKEMNDGTVFRPRLGSSVTSEQLDTGITELLQFRKNILLKNASTGSPRGQRV